MTRQPGGLIELESHGVLLCQSCFDRFQRTKKDGCAWKVDCHVAGGECAECTDPSHVRALFRVGTEWR